MSPRYMAGRYRSFTCSWAWARIVGATMPSPMPKNDPFGIRYFASTVP